MSKTARTLKPRVFGDRDAIVPLSIVGPIVIIFIFLTMVTSDRPMHLSTWAAFAAVCVWFLMGLWMILIGPIVTWTLDDIKYKAARMVISIIVGIGYFAVSAVLMANFSLPI
ncbi:MAG TPA: hypothetical protein VLG36_02025 [Candidatus Chromulinivoraceae bacterium]|nr:hypothetical protein [Candidatus Chromulinivoraceae bacterium]